MRSSCFSSPESIAPSWLGGTAFQAGQQPDGGRTARARWPIGGLTGLAPGAGFRILDANTPAPRWEQAGSAIVTQPWPSRAVGFMHAVSLIGAKEIYQMSNPNLKKPGGKPGQPARKLDPPRSQKPDQAPSQKPAPQPEDNRPIEAAIAAPDVVSIPAVAPANPASIDFQTIAMAYGNYTKKSFEQTKSFVEKLAGVRSLDKAIEIQTEFAKQAYETFVTESLKIRELYSGLASQNFQRFEGAVAKVSPTAR
jgi:hypothetical protein